ncbi:hypothetical protein [Stenotrophomonas sp. 59]|uniref:hypothetical protein n=1 Tax=Stenotrophomonas sp. 59 TaxID=3051120 RepID=UPI00256EB166|nr:hypothetical protein [Stenotrophomonas sp. 59]
MKVLYSLKKDLDLHPERVAETQALTLNQARPLFGLKGTQGLFGSEQWWRSIEDGLIHTETVAGVITSLYVTGQDHRRSPNAFDFRLQDGSIRSEDMYVNAPSEVSCYAVGRRIEITYVFDELKQPLQDGSSQYLDLVAEIRVI